MRPVKVVALADIELTDFFDEDAEAERVSKLGGKVCCLSELESRAVDCLCGAIDSVGGRFATTKR